jgi:preprotein translocase subunit SecD
VATQQKVSRPSRGLIALGVITATLLAIVAGGWYWDDAEWTPALALDLEGGTQIILEPQLQEGEAQPSGEAIEQAVSIIRQRVNGSGVTEAEVTRQGDQNILVSLPGNPDDETLDLVRQSAQLEFRSVLVTGVGFQVPQPDPTAAPSGDPGADPSANPSADPSAAPSGAAATGASVGDAPTLEPATLEPFRAAAPSDVPSAAATGADAGATAQAPEGAGASAEPSAAPEALPAPEPTDGSDLAWVTPEIQQEFVELDCLEAGATAGGFQAAADEPLVTCSIDGSEKYILGPVEIVGENVSDAAGVLATNAQGFTTGEWVVTITFDGEGSSQFAETTRRLFTFPQDSDQNRFAIVLDNVVISAPTVNEPILAGEAQISGNFTQESAQTLANQLKFGALPLSFQVQTVEDVSATLGGDQLRYGVLAGLLGLGLVVVYSLIQYRALGLVIVASLAVVGLLTYLVLLFLSWRQGYRLSLPGVAGLIVAIGVTADSFIVYFERIRDEIRDGRTVATAVEVGWRRASRTILASDAVSLLGAVVLYVLAVGGVRGFAFTLGLTTIIDLLVVFLFTKPVVTLLSRTTFFGSGHKLSGFDPEHLGSTVARNAVRSGARRRAVPAGRVPAGAAPREPAPQPAPTGGTL